jgi:hypothetical protein
MHNPEKKASHDEQRRDEHNCDANALKRRTAPKHRNRCDNGRHAKRQDKYCGASALPRMNEMTVEIMERCGSRLGGQIQQDRSHDTSEHDSESETDVWCVSVHAPPNEKGQAKPPEAGVACNDDAQVSSTARLPGAGGWCLHRLVRRFQVMAHLSDIKPQCLQHPHTDTVSFDKNPKQQRLGNCEMRKPGTLRLRHRENPFQPRSHRPKRSGMLMRSYRILLYNTAANPLNVCISLHKHLTKPGIRQAHQSAKNVLAANKIVSKIPRLETSNTQHLLHGCREACANQ